MRWYSKYISVYGKPFADVPADIILNVKANIRKLQSKEPMVTISVIGYNEEKHLLSCLWSLSDMICKYPVEIIGVDNESQDRTADVFKAVGVPYFTEVKHSCGYARECGLQHAKGKYHVNIDSDTIYPPRYVEILINKMIRKKAVGVSSLWSYIPDAAHSPLAIAIYEFCRNIYLFLLSFKRPELSVRGLVFAYDTALAKKIGIRGDIKRGEDGSLALELKKYGKIIFVRNRKAMPVTGYGTVSADGSFFNSFRKRAVAGIKGITKIFTKQDFYKDEKDNLVQ